MTTRITQLFGIKYPIISGGMVWCSGHKLAAAVSNAGGLGLLGAGSMTADILRDQIHKVKQETQKPFGVNIPLGRRNVEELMAVIVDEKVPIVFTSAGNPKLWTAHLQQHNIRVAHVVSSTTFALKAQQAGVDAIVAEGFEAGGHNGREETTTLCLIPEVAKHVNIPLMAAGGIYNGQTMAAAMCLGAEGVQVGTAFALSEESSAHPNFKRHCIGLGEGGTKLLLKKIGPVRLSQNAWRNKVEEAENRGASAEKLKEILGFGRSKIGIFDGDLEEGELEIGQASANISEILPVEVIITNMVSEYKRVLSGLNIPNE